MAKITKLELDGFKAQQSLENLSGLDLFIGPNGTGKSARLEAASLAILGYVPGRGKKADDTMALAAGDQISVGLELDNGFGCARMFERRTSTNRRTGEPTVRITESVTVSPAMGETNDTQRKARIDQELGSFGIHLDFAEFLAMSAAKRREFLYGLVSGTDEWTKVRVADLLRERLLTNELQANNPEAYAIMEETIGEALNEWKDGLTVQDGVTAMLEWAKTQASYWNAKRRDAEGAVRQLAELKNQLNATDRDIAERKEALEKLREELTKSTAEIARAEEIKTTWQSRQKRLESLKQDLAKLTDVEPPDTYSVNQQIERLIAQVVEPQMDDGTALDAQLEVIAGEIELVSQELSSARQAMDQASVEAKTLLRAAETASTTGGLCVINRMIKCDKDFTPFVVYVKEQAEEHQATATTAKQRINELTDKLKSLRANERELKATAAARLRAISEHQRKNEHLRKEIAKLENEKNQQIRAAEKEAARREAIAEEIKRLEGEPVKPVPETDILEKQVAGLRSQIAEIQSNIEQQEKARITLTNMQGAMLESSQAEHKYNAAKNIQDELGPHGVQGELLKAGLEPLRAEIDANLRAFGIDNEFAFLTQSDRGAETFDFGWMSHGAFISYDALSTGQRILVLVAMLTALLNRACPPVRLLTIDNVENLDLDNRQALLEGLATLHNDDKIDNVLMAGVIDASVPKGWTVHHVDDSEDQASEEVA